MPPGNPACTPSTAHGRTHAQECRREETNAIRSLLNTAKVMEDNPTALRLKELETLEKVTDKVGNTVAWSSAGVLRFKGSRKSTPFAAQLVAEDAAKKAMEHGMKQVGVFVKGPGTGRESALRAIANTGLKITLIKDVTPIAHNGCRPPKRRRV